MGSALAFACLLLCLGKPGLNGPTPVDPNSFHTSATFSVDGDAMTLSTAVATIEPRLGAPGYSWLRVTFYSFPVAADDLTAVMKGDVKQMDNKWVKLAANTSAYNHGHAVIQLSVDQSSKVWQVDMSIPGHACSIAPFESDVKNFLQDYRFDGKTLRLKSKGSYVCDMKSLGIPDQRYSWDIDLTATVFEKVK